MKIHIMMTDDNGDRYEGDARLVRVVKKSKSPTVAASSPSPPNDKLFLSFEFTSLYEQICQGQERF
jgi:hypothetical protein